MFRFVILILLMVAASCCKPEFGKGCNSDNPIQDIEWLNELSNDCSSYNECANSIFQGKYKGCTVYYTMWSGPLCDVVFIVNLRDCSGEIVKEYGSGDNQLFMDEVDEQEELFTCP